MFIVFVCNIISVLRQSHSALSQFCVELACEVGNELLHDGINLLVVQCLLLILQDEEKTLNDKQIDAIMKKLIANLTGKLNAELR